MIAVDPHPLLDLGQILASFPESIGQVATPHWLTDLLSTHATAPLRPNEEVRTEIRNLLRHGGYKPTGRGKPSAEYLWRAAEDASLTPINAVVDLGNAVSMHSGLPISVVDLDRCHPPLRVGIAVEGASYEFNASGQTIDLAGLLCLHDAQGPLANAVKDAQRTKTNQDTREVLIVVWGCNRLGNRTILTVEWAKQLLKAIAATLA